MIGTPLGAALFTVKAIAVNTMQHSVDMLMGLVSPAWLFCINSANTGTWTTCDGRGRAAPDGNACDGDQLDDGHWPVRCNLWRLLGTTILLALKWDFDPLFMALTFPIGIAIAAAYHRKGATPAQPRRATIASQGQPGNVESGTRLALRLPAGER
ncbi:hypothetical protein ACU4GD_45080 [Cupriavidus basilensis]